ncbi:deoxyribonuclease V [Aquicella lusitana]|uniref:Endonuclease V n=1 Tax=Aquicella lusitana TaxID=254246 RepID=A0A370G8R9_9COXI|nr:deoxyribonuclease V [Aquicella lusitana]RDI40185.1 endonuclease V [Aquicella lusitana]VVC72424.1 Endonuclease V [Aquicella lusitana]
MKLPPPLHAWQVTPQEAITIQKQLASRITLKKPDHPLLYIAGLDAAFSQDGKTCIAAVVLWDSEKQRVVEQHSAFEPVHFPYIPGLLSFREAPALLAALGKLQQKPDALMCDGQGIAHPRRLGIACHIGLFTQIPSLGCGKSRLVGRHEEPGKLPGQKSPLIDKGEIVGTVLRTKTNVRPVFVSVGNEMDLATAETIVLRCTRGYRLPEPTRLADRLVALIKKELG